MPPGTGRANIVGLLRIPEFIWSNSDARGYFGSSSDGRPEGWESRRRPQGVERKTGGGSDCQPGPRREQKKKKKEKKARRAKEKGDLTREEKRALKRDEWVAARLEK